MPDRTHVCTSAIIFYTNIYVLFISLKVRSLLTQNVYRAVVDFADVALLETVTDDHVAAPKKLLKCMANRTHAAMRPSGPRTLDFVMSLLFLFALFTL